MRDLLVLAFVGASSIAGFVRPWFGVLALAVMAYLNPHRYAWGFSMEFPVYFTVFAATAAGILLNGRDRQAFPWTRETKLFFMLLAWFTVTTYWAPDIPDQAQKQWVKVMKIYVGIFPTLFMITSRDRLRWLIMVIAGSFGLIGLKGGIWALGTGFQFQVRGPYLTFYGGNNEIALALNMTLPLLFLAAKEAKQKVLKTGFYTMFVCSIFSIISSFSRGGFLTLATVLGLMFLTGRRKWLFIPLAALAIGIAAQHVPERWYQRMESIKTYDQDLSVQGRFIAWQFAIDKAVEHPLTGGGFETFQNAWVDAHSAYFEILGEHGFLALGLWLSLLFGTILALQRLRKETAWRPELEWVGDYGRAIQISLLGYAVGGAFLGVAYWDYFYHLIAVCVILKILVYRALAEAPVVGPEPQLGQGYEARLARAPTRSSGTG
jgi:probable O-glycosylation ligase (exosortase A-associated)